MNGGRRGEEGVFRLDQFTREQETESTPNRLPLVHHFLGTLPPLTLDPLKKELRWERQKDINRNRELTPLTWTVRWERCVERGSSILTITVRFNDRHPMS